MTNIVMLVKDRPNLTRQSLNSLFKNTEQSQFTLTVVDDHSELETAKILLAHGHRPNVSLRMNEMDNRITAQARNWGIRGAALSFENGYYLYLSDNDVFFTPGWLDKLILAYDTCEELGFKLIGGQNHPYHMPIAEVQTPYTKVFEYQALAGTSQLMTWETWNQFGPLDETGAPGPCQGEDCLFGDRIRKAGFKLGAVYPPVVYDCGITQTGGNKSPGWDVKKRVVGVIYE